VGRCAVEQLRVVIPTTAQAKRGSFCQAERLKGIALMTTCHKNPLASASSGGHRTRSVLPQTLRGSTLACRTGPMPCKLSREAGP
jgi:hypothetical protein